MDLERLIGALAPAEVLNPTAVDVVDLAYDTRSVAPGALFFCVRGQRRDGHELATDAVEAGAVALVVDHALDVAVPQLVVPDTRAAMAQAAAEFFGHPSQELTIAGVTGTNGKTTTTFLLFAILAAAARRPGLLGTVEVRVGGERRPALRTTPEAIDLQRTLREMLDAGDRSCAMEATSHGSELGRLSGTRFAAIAFTNLSQDHLDLHGTMERYFDAKRRLFVEGEPPPAAVNVGDEYGRRLADELRRLDRAPLLTFAYEGEADLVPDSVELSPCGARIGLDGLELESPLLGRFNVENVLAAVAVARLLEIPDDAIAQGIASVRGVPGRFEAVDEGQPFLVVVDYSHKPDALQSALAAARGLAEGRVICVFGCAGDRDRGKRPLMARAAEEGSDVAILTSDNPRSEDPEAIVREVLTGASGDMAVEVDRRKAIERAIELAQPGDFVLVAGKGHETYQELRDGTISFDDREVAREALRRQRAKA